MASTPVLLDSLALKKGWAGRRKLLLPRLRRRSERRAPLDRKCKRVSPVSKRQGQQMRPVHKAHYRLPGCRFAAEWPRISVVRDPIRLFEANFAVDLRDIWRFAGEYNQKIAMRQVRRRATDSSVCTSGRPVRPAKRSRKNLDTSDTYEALPRILCPAEAFDCFLWTCSRVTP